MVAFAVIRRGRSLSKGLKEKGVKHNFELKSGRFLYPQLKTKKLRI